MTLRLHNRRRRILALVAIALLGATTAWAYWVAPSSGNGSGHVGALGTPSISSAVPGTGTVALGWSTVTAPGAGTVKYYVTRDGGAPAGDCPTAASPATGSSCTDGGLPAGSHKYTVTAVYRTWTKRSAESSVTVATGALDHLVLSAASTTPTAGTGDNLTITAKDAGGTTVSSYTGAKSLTFGGASAIGSKKPTVASSSSGAVAFGTATAINFTNGVATVSSSKNGVMTLYRAETATITVTDGTISGGAGISVTVSPASTGAFSLSTPSSPTAGVSFSETLTATDQYGNPTPSYTGSHSVTFEGPTKSPNNKSPSYPSSLTFASGTATANITLYDAQTTTLTASLSAGSGTSASFTVSPAGAASLSVASPGSPTAGSAINETLTAKDAFGNTATSYEGTKAIAFSGPTNAPNGKAPEYPSTVSFSAGAGTASIVLYNAQTTTLGASDGTNSGTSSSFTVAGASAVSFTLPTPSTQTAGNQFNATITAKDTYGNTATYSGTKSIVFSGPVASPNGKAPSYPSTVSFGSGSGTAKEITLYAAASTTLTATQGTITGTTASFNVGAASASVFAFGAISAQTAGIAFNVSLTAQDAYGNLAAYEGSKTVTFSGPESSPNGKPPAYPSSISFSGGAGTASITLYDATAATTLTAEQGGGAVKGKGGSFAVGSSTTSGLSLANLGEKTAGSAFNVTLTAVDAYGNATASYEGSKAITFSGAASSPNGKAPVYPASVTFAGGVGTALLTLYNAAATTLGASDGTNSGTSSSFTVAGASAASFSLSTPAPTAGTQFGETITAKDAYGNTAVGYTGTKTVTFSGPTNSPTGKAPSYPSTVTFSSSVGTAQITLYNAAATTLTATQGTITGTSASFTVSPAAANAFSFGSIASQTAGNAFSITLTATDLYGNAVADGAKTLTFKGSPESPSEKAPSYPASVTFAGGAGTASVTLYDATAATALTAELGSAKGTSANFTVSPGAAARLAWTSFSGSGGAEGLCLFTCTWSGLGSKKTFTTRVSVTDQYGNTVSGLGSGHEVKLEKTLSSASLSTSALTIASSGEATTTTSVTYTSPTGSWSSDTLTAKSTPYSDATATLKK